MKFSAIWRLLAALWRLCLVYGIPAILFWTMSIYWFVNGKSGLGLITGTLAALTTILWYYFVREVDKKEKELAEKNQQKQPLETVKGPALETMKPPIRSANREEALMEILRDLKEPLDLKEPGSETPTEEKQKG